ncbi:hypothetical protein J5N97_019816 [Dioscorea zingiberensis]|uniref:Uncharacterized protein n=1 Tax=Dioscorea zingiberensis TaxID=325984 RepID=A0A9D5CEK2_9LILI|nr:hypothetical protein J5N97_019816 [Dioscorea zingiberensis]
MQKVSPHLGQVHFSLSAWAVKFTVIQCHQLLGETETNHLPHPLSVSSFSRFLSFTRAADGELSSNHDPPLILWHQPFNILSGSP